MKSAGKLLRRSLRVLLALFVLLNLLCVVHGYKLTHFYADVSTKMGPPGGWQQKLSYVFLGPKAGKSRNDSLPKLPYITQYITTSDGLRLELWDMPADSSLPTVVMFHGHGGKKSSVLVAAMQFHAWGYPVVMVDFRAHGGSDGEQCTIGIKESADVKAAYDYTVDKTKKQPILWGISLGAATIMRSVAENNLQPQKLILEMPFASLYEAVEGRIRIMGIGGVPVLAPLLTFWGGAVNGVWTFGHKPYLFAKKINCPVLLQWGRNDPRVTSEETQRIFSNISTPKKLVVYEHSAHENLFEKEPALWQASVSAFLKDTIVH